MALIQRGWFWLVLFGYGLGVIGAMLWDALAKRYRVQP